MKSISPLLDINGIHKSHDGLPTLKGIDLALGREEIFCLLGPSGCGKTTLLRIIAGLEKPDQGHIRFDEVDLAKVPPYRRQFSMMFQEFALFPHKNVFENIVFGLRMQKWEEEALKQRAYEMIGLVGMEGLENRDINDLSGGERQRVALARSLAPNPRLLMLDEPMGSLDRALRERLILDLRRILKKVGVATLFVTHDQNEAFVLADRIAVFNQGYIEQVATPSELFRNPANEFVARFLGFQNLVPATVKSNGGIESAIGTLNLPHLPHLRQGSALLLIRPEAARIVTDHAPVNGLEIEIQGHVIDSRFQGANYQVQVAVNDSSVLVFHLSSECQPPRPESLLKLALNTAALNVI